MVQWCRETGQDIDIMGRGYKPFSEKSAGLAPYRYSIVIENAREENYFTEKLVDALLCNTVPIYWGCPNIADFFDTSGMILCETMADLQRAVEQMSEADYTSRLPGLEAARNVAIGYADIYPRAAKTLLEAG
jgi:Glycosyltransferase family 10 (fucosyltransferase) C-term